MATTTERGFSLLELIIVLAIVGAVAAIALPAWNEIVLSIKLTSAARLIQSELQLLKNRSATESAAFNVIYAAGAREFQIQQDAAVLAVKSLPPGIVIIKGGAVKFSARGTANGNRIRLMSQTSQCQQVVVSQTGRIRNCRVKCGDDC
jgi:prepilin-type N-terminal cleavage/methylation domain-containing protein